MREWYFWEDRLPADVDIGPSLLRPDELLDIPVDIQPGRRQWSILIDRFSFINTAEADQQFFGEGRFEAFGFGSRFCRGR